MITVLITPNKIHLSGHANTAPRGSDIVCSAVSALTLTLIQGLKEIAHMGLYESVESGNICIEWQTMNDTGKALIDTWFLGIRSIADEYPVIEFL
ncbi:MAG: ribosomal-processing cysteine protease Prp [Lachnospiraceae bacterium]|nr:ribosomal-processing cysteine protease Prp [Lachnospiraceae bacterium]